MSDAYAGPAGAKPASGYTKPMPKIDAWNRPFWEATRDRVFLAQRDEAGNTWFPPSPVSPFTRTEKWEWVPLSGKGIVVSWVVFHQKYFTGFAAELPYNVALVELDEGPRIFTNLVEVDNKDIDVGKRVHVTFREVDGKICIPVFRPSQDIPQ
jgi:uncharacterized OB-fold protein